MIISAAGCRMVFSTVVQRDKERKHLIVDTCKYSFCLSVEYTLMANSTLNVLNIVPETSRLCDSQKDYRQLLDML